MNALNASNLHTIRTFHGLHQSELADLLGVGQSYVAMIESGSRPFTEDLRSRTLQALGLSHEEVSKIIAIQAGYEAARNNYLK